MMTEPGKHPFACTPDALLAAHTALAYGIAKRYTGRGLPLEDLRQEALMGLLDAARSFDSTKGAEFSTYATFWIKKRVLAALDRESSSGGSLYGTGDVDSLPDTAVPSGQERPSAPVPHEPVSGLNSLPQAGLSFPDNLPEAERAILDACYNRCLPLKQVAEEMGISVERVKQLRAKALRRIRTCRDRPPSS